MYLTYGFEKEEFSLIQTKPNQQDPEAQKLSSSSSQAQPPPPAAAGTQAQPPQYVRTGRGGAGNFADARLDQQQQQQDVVDRTHKAAVATAGLKPTPRTAGLTGRGGAGNWTDLEAEGARGGQDDDDDEEKTRRQQQIAAQTAQDIDANLPAPPKTYHQHDRNME